jgi:hypothetical protein
MKILAAIPMHNYSEGVIRCIHWLRDTTVFQNEGHELCIRVLDDRSDDAEREEVEGLLDRTSGFNTWYINKGLRGSLKEAGRVAVEDQFDAVLVCESDACPNYSAMKSMLSVFQDPPPSWIRPDDKHFPKWRQEGKQVIKYGSSPPDDWEGWPKAVASVSPHYTWNGEACYPTQGTWFRVQDDGNCYQILKLKEHGLVSMTQAVPFLFSLWQPAALAKITDAMPELYQLDKALGLQLWSEGYIHLRLLNRSVGHAGGGRRSSS